ncbi:MAG TPA: M23 family metallopeptidase [Terriglobia bacterium]|nr:M23 family metallopeptidase [Terriglobia bacterium]
MNRKFYTVLITPGVHGKVYKVQLPFYAFLVAIGITVLCFLMIAGLATRYTWLLVKVAKYNTVRTERDALRNQYHSLHDRVTRANAKLNSLQSLATEVAMTYGGGNRSRLRVTPALLSLTVLSNPVLATGDSASSNAIKNVSFDASHGPLSRSLFPTVVSIRSAMPAIWPVHGYITGRFGKRLDPFSGEGAFHPGVDIGARYGTDVKATGDGMVIEAERDAGYGRSILVDHGDGITTRYAHMSRIFVIVGEEVKRGELIGAVGMSGRTTGPHLHYEVLIHGAPVNPSRFLPARLLAFR